MTGGEEEKAFTHILPGMPQPLALLFPSIKVQEYEKSHQEPETIFIQISQNRFLKVNVNVSER